MHNLLLLQHYIPFPMTLMISVDTTLPPEEHSTLVPFISELTLLITISDIRGEVYRGSQELKHSLSNGEWKHTGSITSRGDESELRC